MTLRPYQQEISLSTLYSCVANGLGDGSSLQPHIEIIGGVANIYGTDSTPASPPTGMTNSVPDGLQGIENFAVVPNYLYVTQASGTITKVILSGIAATVVV